MSVNIEVEKHKFLFWFSIFDVNINKIILSNKVPLGKQCFRHYIGYNDSRKVGLLCGNLPKMMIARKT